MNLQIFIQNAQFDFCLIMLLNLYCRDVEDLRAALNECNQRVKELTLKLDNFDDVPAFQVKLTTTTSTLMIT